MKLDELLAKLDRSKLPRHIAIIPDGNRRWAKGRGKTTFEGHLRGAKVMEKLLGFILRHLEEIKIITVYAMSLDNFVKRSSRERNYLFKILERSFRKLGRSKLIHEFGVKVSFFGRLELLPKRLSKLIEHLQEITKRYDQRFLNICVCYDGREEIAMACREIAKKVVDGMLKPDEIDENVVKSHLYTRGFDPPDLIVRSGGERRLSSFLSFDAAYSELYFSERLWPDFDELELLKILIEYGGRERRFGK